jgi:hypothetical protein
MEVFAWQHIRLLLLNPLFGLLTLTTGAMRISTRAIHGFLKRTRPATAAYLIVPFDNPLYACIPYLVDN